MEDVWGEEEHVGNDLAYEQEMARRNWNRLKEKHENVGYKEGISQAKGARMQEGFDLGFKEGSVAGRSLGEMLGCALVRHQLYKQSQSDSCSIDKYHQRSPPVTAPASIITITTTTTNTASASAPYTALTIRWSDLSMKLASTRFQDVFPQQHFIPPQQHSATASITASSLDILKKEFVEATSDQSK